MNLRIIRKNAKEYRNSQLPSGSVTLDNFRLDGKLLAKSKVPVWCVVLYLPFVALAVYGLIVNFTDLSTLKGSDHWLRNAVDYLSFLGLLSAFLWFSFAIFSSAVASWPTTFQYQTFHYTTRFVTNLLGFLMLSFFFAFLLFSFFDVVVLAGPEGASFLNSLQERDAGELIVMGILMLVILLLWLLPLSVAIFFAYLWYQSGLVIARIMNWWVQRGPLRASFDKEVYDSGDQFRVQVRDKASLKDGRRYRVHLSYVDELTFTEKTDQAFLREGETRSMYYRDYGFSKFMDVTSAELQRGIDWSIPDFIHPGRSVKRYPITYYKRGVVCRYWELLIEEHNSHFHARFFVNVKAPTPSA
ncbi:hypothetical protein [Neolewinella antarctica]|uniref:Uncharacterized protein n=1 Tax=Neolewinella antarctica TaxID=442734 RepID=A0ABX0XBV4_9BACT|nr:hypothetical protein [Neolewinella antarctica]NJC26313.1 hypothetical protein [Neolewinella antarctica]